MHCDELSINISVIKEIKTMLVTLCVQVSLLELKLRLCLVHSSASYKSRIQGDPKNYSN